VSARATAIAFAVLAILLTLAQDVFPARDWYHGWQYITVLALAILVMTVYVWRVWRARAAGRRLALALVGAVAVGVAGLLSGLIGPDTVTVIGTPGTVTPVPDLNAAAFFPAADPQSLARGDATVTVRKRDGSAIAIGSHPVPIGLSVAFTETRPAAYVVARDANGNRLTVTQPNNPSFLSPIVVFRQSQDIHGHTFPLDTIAVPGMHRIARILYFSPEELAATRHETKPGDAGAILSVSDDAGAQKGLTMVPSGTTAAIDNVRYTVTLGRYPVLNVASAPLPFAVVAGLLVFIAAGFWSRVPLKKPSAPVSNPSYSQS
jgi:hypothetical protein